MSQQHDFHLAVHGGAFQTVSDEKGRTDFLREVLSAGADILGKGGDALAACVACVRMMENSGLYHAGKGVTLNHDGFAELDASVMTGHDRKAGAVAALRSIRNPVLAAQAVMEKTPHVFLVGAGAEEWAVSNGLETVDPATYFQPLTKSLQADEDEDAGCHGTVGAVARDVNGHLAAATSTAGMPEKLWGRVGDTPVIGAATWADDHVAVSCTGHGEYFIRAAAAHEVSARIRYGGESLDDAVSAVLRTDIAERGGWGGMIAVDRAGRIVSNYACSGMFAGTVTAGSEPQIFSRGRDGTKSEEKS